MLVARPLSEYTVLEGAALRSWQDLGVHSNLEALALGPHEGSRHALACALHVTEEQVNRWLSVFELTALPGVTEAEARLLVWLGVVSVGRLAELGSTGLGRLQAAAHRPTLSRLGLTPLEPTRVAALVQVAWDNPWHPRLGADRQTQAGARWRDGLGAREQLVGLLRGGSQGPVLAATGELRAELNLALLRQQVRPQAPTPGQAASRAFAQGAAWVAAHAALRGTDAQAREALERRLRAQRKVAPDDAAQRCALGLVSEWGAACRDAERALTEARGVAAAWRGALRRRDPARLARKLREALPTLEMAAVRLLRWPEVPLAVWQVREVLALDAPELLAKLAGSRAAWLDRHTEARVLVGALHTLAPVLALDVQQPDSPGAQARRRLARLYAPGAAGAWRSDWGPVARGEPAAWVVLSGDLRPEPVAGRLRLYSHDGHQQVLVQGPGLVLETLPPYALTPGVLGGRWDPASGVLELGTPPPGWEQALVVEAARLAPLLPDGPALWASRAAADAVAVLTRAQEAQDV